MIIQDGPTRATGPWVYKNVSIFWIWRRKKMNVNLPMEDYFFVDGAPLVLQVSVIICLMALNYYAAERINHVMGHYSLSSIFIYLNIILILPFAVSQANGFAGFASAHGVSAYGFNFKMFILIIFQSVLIPIILLFAVPFRRSGLFHFNFRSKFFFYVFVVFLILYLLAYLVIVKPGIYHALIGNFEEAKRMRVIAVLGETSRETGSNYLFNYKNLAVWLLQSTLVGMYLLQKSKLKILTIIFFFLALSFINFSKGSVVGGFLVLIWAWGYKNRSYSLMPLFFTLILSIITLVSYTFFFHSSGILLENALGAIFRRIYNNSSSVYLQLELYGSLVPNYLYIQDWGLVGDIFDLKPLIPKQMVYGELYEGDGQGGSFLMSEVYFAFGWSGILLIPIIVSPIIILDNIMYRVRRPFGVASSWVLGNMIFFGTLISITLHASPFSVINIFTILRVEYLFILVLIFLFTRSRRIPL